MPTLSTDEGKRIVAHRHREHGEFAVRWQWLQDSLEGGMRYRDAEYGFENYVTTWPVRHPGEERIYTGRYSRQLPIHNLIRHPQEYPVPPGMGGMGDWTADAPETGDEYEFRRQLTPVPDFVREAIQIHLSRIYAREVRRVAPPGPYEAKLEAWWEDVDGSGQRMDDWMHEIVAPLFLASGQLDLAFDHPAAPPGSRVASRADEARLRLDTCIAKYILPQNVEDWDLRPDQEYEWVKVREYVKDSVQYRVWTDEGWTLYDADGAVIGRGQHPYGRVPIFRAFDKRVPRCDNVGKSRYERIAEIQRAYYNVDSELTLSNSLAAHASLSGPEEYCRGQAVVQGPSHVLPKIRTPGGGYEGWEYVAAPVDTADKLRQRLLDYRDEADRAACLLKPAGQTTGATVSQSGISKQMDLVAGNDLLTSIAKSLQQMETWAAQLALVVLSNGKATPEMLKAVKVTYPTEFSLFTLTDLATAIQDLQGVVSLAGALPEAETELVTRFELMALPGLPDDRQEVLRLEAARVIAEAAASRAAPAPAPEPPPDGVPVEMPAGRPAAQQAARAA